MTFTVPQGLPRQRSQAIAIKRSRPGEKYYMNNNDTEKATEGGDAEIYAYATWRMYKRIIDHRRKNLLLRSTSQKHQEDLQQSSTKPSSSSSSALCPNGLSSSPSSRSRVEKEHHHHNGGGMMMLVHPSSPSVIHGQRYYVHQHVPYEYSSDDYLSCSEDDHEIFDLEL